MCEVLGRNPLDLLKPNNNNSNLNYCNNNNNNNNNNNKQWLKKNTSSTKLMFTKERTFKLKYNNISIFNLK